MSEWSYPKSRHREEGLGLPRSRLQFEVLKHCETHGCLLKAPHDILAVLEAHGSSATWWGRERVMAFKVCRTKEGGHATCWVKKRPGSEDIGL